MAARCHVIMHLQCDDMYDNQVDQFTLWMILFESEFIPLKTYQSFSQSLTKQCSRWSALKGQVEKDAGFVLELQMINVPIVIHSCIVWIIEAASW